jgi:DNA-binding SARP family transcriptional activator
VRYLILGPVGVQLGAGPVILERPQRRAVLAVLVLNANQVVSVEQLIEALWGGAPPATARAQLHALIAAVRRSLRETGGEDAINTRAGGYLLTLADEASDLRRFEVLVDRARGLTDPRDASRQLREALALWTGTPLDGVTAAFVESARASLIEKRLTVHEQLIEIELILGRHRDVVPELTALVAAHPLRERLVGQLMVALYRSGRQSEALQAGRALRRLLADAEGLDPGPELAALETAILRADPSLAAPTAASAAAPPVVPVRSEPAWVVPRQLPPPVHLVGRDDELAAIDDLATVDADTPVAVVLTGDTGFGKTALAVHWARSRADRFPDGQVFLDGSLSTEEAVTEVLRAFAVPADSVPTDPSEAAAACRMLIASRRVLIVVDDANGSDLVRTLLGADGRSMVLATATTDIEAATGVPVGPLRPAAAARLLGALLGPERTDGDAVDLLARRYGGQPLALLMVGANLARHPEHPVHARAAPGTAHAHRRSVAPHEAAFAVACADLDEQEWRLLRLIASTPGRDVGVSAVTALLDATPERTDQLLRRLTAAQLLLAGRPGRFRLHTGLRALAAGAQPPGAAVAEPPGEVAAAFERLAAVYLVAVDHAARLLYPHLTRLPVPGGGADAAVFDTPAGALGWLECERVNLIAMIEHAATAGHGPVAWLLADSLRGYFALTMRIADWNRSAHTALAAAAAAGSAEARSAAHLSLAELHLRSSQHPGAPRDAWQVLATKGRRRVTPPSAAGRAVPGRRRANPTLILAAMLGVLVLCTSSVRSGRAADAARGSGPGRLVGTYSGVALRQHEAIDFDTGKRDYSADDGMDIQPWASGNHLSARSGAKLAWVPDASPLSYDTCNRVPPATRDSVLRGLHDVPGGRRFCVYTRLGRVAMATLTRPPRLQREDVVFDYVVWQGTAPPVSPAIPAAPGTELRRAAITLPDPMGLDIDGTVSVVPQDDSRVDVTPYGKGSVLRVADSALIGVLPVGSTPTYAACASLPAATRTTAVPELRSLPRGQSICLYSYPGRVAMLTPVRPTDDGHPDLALTIVVWQGAPTVGIPGQEPAPWDRDQYPNAAGSPEKSTGPGR